MKFATEQEIRSHHPADHNPTAGETAAGESLPGKDRAFARPVTDIDAGGWGKFAGRGIVIGFWEVQISGL